jgi:hypothetical protein
LIEKNSEPYIKIDNTWIGKKASESHVQKLSNSDYLYMSTLISTYLNWRTNESRFNIKDIQYWFGIDIRNAKKKLKLLDMMQEMEYLKYEYPVRDMIVITDLNDAFYPDCNFTIINDNELQNIINNSLKYTNVKEENKSKIGISNSNLFAVYFTIKSYMNLQSGEYISFPSESSICNHTKIGSKSVCNCISELKRMKLIDYINKGYNKEQKRNLGNVYTLYDKDAHDRLFKYINSNKT